MSDYDVSFQLRAVSRPRSDYERSGDPAADTVLTLRKIAGKPASTKSPLTSLAWQWQGYAGAVDDTMHQYVANVFPFPPTTIFPTPSAWPALSTCLAYECRVSDCLISPYLAGGYDFDTGRVIPGDDFLDYQADPFSALLNPRRVLRLGRFSAPTVEVLPILSTSTEDAGDMPPPTDPRPAIINIDPVLYGGRYGPGYFSDDNDALTFWSYDSVSGDWSAAYANAVARYGGDAADGVRLLVEWDAEKLLPADQDGLIVPWNYAAGASSSEFMGWSPYNDDGGFAALDVQRAAVWGVWPHVRDLGVAAIGPAGETVTLYWRPIPPPRFVGPPYDTFDTAIGPSLLYTSIVLTGSELNFAASPWQELCTFTLVSTPGYDPPFDGTFSGAVTVANAPAPWQLVVVAHDTGAAILGPVGLHALTGPYTWPQSVRTAGGVAAGFDVPGQRPP